MSDRSVARGESRPLVIACGALVSELRAVLAATGLDDAAEVRYLPAALHNRPERLPDEVRAVLADAEAVEAGRTVLLAYGDCGTGGGFDRLLEATPNVRRLPGAHCYEFFAGSTLFHAEHEAELGTFFLTDFLAKHFDALVWQGLGLDRHPHLRDLYFGNYRRVLLLTQSGDRAVIEAGQTAAARLGLAFEMHRTGLDHFATAVQVGIRTKTEEAA
jgi:hypothetical protein